MKCTYHRLGPNRHAIVCSSRPRRQRCACGAWATKLCDFPVERKVWQGREIRQGEPRIVQGTCSKPLCDSCAVHVGPGKDHCPDHQPELALL